MTPAAQRNKRPPLASHDAVFGNAAANGVALVPSRALGVGDLKSAQQTWAMVAAPADGDCVRRLR